METCGRCGASVPSGSELCPACGALLAAYRTPVPSTPAADPPEQPPVLAADASRFTPRRAPAVPVVPASSDAPADTSPSTDYPARLREARADLVRALAERQHRMPRAVAGRPWMEPPAQEERAPTTTRRPPSPGAMTGGRPRSPVQSRLPHGPPVRPRRPGFIVKGSPEVALLWGIALLLGGCFVFGVAGWANGSAPLAVIVAAAAVATVGSVVTAFSLLVVLVRRDRER